MLNRQVQAKLRSCFIINMYNLLYSSNTAHKNITMCSVQYGVYKRYIFQMYTFSVH